MKTPIDIIFTAVLLLFCSGLLAQEAVSATGGDADGSGGSLSYTAGQVTYVTALGSGGSLAQGVQQPFEIVTGTDEVKWIDLAVSAYPNPTKDQLMLKVENEMLRGFSYHLYDMGGKLLASEEIEGPRTAVNMNNLEPSIYVLRILQDSKEIKVFKIIKN